MEGGSSSLMAINSCREAAVDGGSTVTPLCSVLLFSPEALMQSVLIAAELGRPPLHHHHTTTGSTFTPPALLLIKECVTGRRDLVPDKQRS